MILVDKLIQEIFLFHIIIIKDRYRIPQVMD